MRYDSPRMLGAALISASLAVVTAHHTGAQIKIDGKLDEPAWSQAGIIKNLTQQEPVPGAPSPYETEVRVLVSNDKLYIGFICKDPQPDLVTAHTMQRDTHMGGDDTVAVAIDPFLSGRRGYFFQVNAAGARTDGLISGPERISIDWDGVWEAAAAKTPYGWSAEIAIDSRTLRFPPGTNKWGFNVERKVARDRTVLRWSGISLDATFIDMSRAGILKGVGNLRQGTGVSISPYALVRSNRQLGDEYNTLSGDAGADLSYSFTPELVGMLTINTDFAETESDTRRINLTRFPLFFPEKRSFFLEGSDLFSFGIGLHHDFIPFFSRRIGLVEGQQVPMLAGIKLLGHHGKWGIAALDVQMGESSITKRTNLFASRLTYDATENLTLGTILTIGDPKGIQDNALAGFDINWHTSKFRGDKNLTIGAWFARSYGDSSGAGSRTGWGFKLDYPNDLWDVFFLFKEFGQGLDPALGFLPRPGTRWYQGGGAYQPRPSDTSRWSWVRQFFFELYASYVENTDGEVESWRVFTAPFNAVTDSGEHLEFNISPQFERLVEPFEVAEGVVIPAGDYSFTRYRLELESSPHRPLSASTRVWFGDFYTGDLIQWEAELAWRSGNGTFQASVQSENDFGKLPEGNFVKRLWQLRLVYSFSPDLVLSSYIQYDSDSRDLGANTRLRWTITPGSDLYVVWNRNWWHPPDGSSLALHPVSDQLVVKLRWTFRP